ncbi:MAG: MFS transporter, partial [Acetobacteraceae bacterium]|nr:MFS transporter [Acetobacteraceae bacterium]
FFWGWLGTRIGLSTTLLAAAATGLVFAVAVRRYDLDQVDAGATGGAIRGAPLAPAVVAPELAAVVVAARGRVLETQAYRIDPADRSAFLAAMADVRDVRGRTGAIVWQLYEDVARADTWMEVWTMENWTDHLREQLRMSEADRATVARATDFHRGEPLPPSRFIAVPPQRAVAGREPGNIASAVALAGRP